MTNKLKFTGSVLIIALLAFIAWNLKDVPAPVKTLFGANECASGQTCLPSMELTGPNSGVTNALQIDSGIFNNAGTSVFSGAVSLTSTFKLGSSGTTQNQQNVGQCYIYPYGATISANADVKFECNATANASGAGGAGALAALPGITAASMCNLTLSTTTASMATTSIALGYANSYVSITGASASTTSGYISGYLHNSSTSPIAFGSTTYGATANASGTAQFSCFR